MIARNSEDLFQIRKLWYSASVIGGIITILWLIFLPFWGGVAAFLNSNNQIVGVSINAMKLLIIPYIILALNIFTDNYVVVLEACLIV